MNESVHLNSTSSRERYPLLPCLILDENYFTNIKTRPFRRQLGPGSETLHGGNTCPSDLKKIC